jgi:hypothetical protein
MPAAAQRRKRPVVIPTSSCIRRSSPLFSTLWAEAFSTSPRRRSRSIAWRARSLCSSRSSSSRKRCFSVTNRLSQSAACKPRNGLERISGGKMFGHGAPDQPSRRSVAEVLIFGDRKAEVNNSLIVGRVASLNAKHRFMAARNVSPPSRLGNNVKR